MIAKGGHSGTVVTLTSHLGDQNSNPDLTVYVGKLGVICFIVYSTEP